MHSTMKVPHDSSFSNDHNKEWSASRSGRWREKDLSPVLEDINKVNAQARPRNSTAHMIDKPINKDLYKSKGRRSVKKISQPSLKKDPNLKQLNTPMSKKKRKRMMKEFVNRNIGSHQPNNDIKFLQENKLNNLSPKSPFSSKINHKPNLNLIYLKKENTISSKDQELK